MVARAWGNVRLECRGAPGAVVVESGGCLTAALDREADYHSVVARLLRKGAVPFSGNSRESIAECELQRQEFWNGVLSGQTIGQAHWRSMNSAVVTILDKKEDAEGLSVSASDSHAVRRSRLRHAPARPAAFGARPLRRC